MLNTHSFSLWGAFFRQSGFSRPRGRMKALQATSLPPAVVFLFIDRAPRDPGHHDRLLAPGGSAVGSCLSGLASGQQRVR
jgi:hypothetical protein